jgi:hypothetical protein
MTKKKALGVDPLSWIKPTIDVDEEPQKAEKESVPRIDNMPSSSSDEMPSHETLQKDDKKIPKFQTYEIKLTLRLRENQLEFLSRFEREIMKNRSPVNRRERITKNSILRAMIDAFGSLSIETNEIGDEDELKKRFIKAFDLKGGGNLPT